MINTAFFRELIFRSILMRKSLFLNFVLCGFMLFLFILVEQSYASVAYINLYDVDELSETNPQ